MIRGNLRIVLAACLPLLLASCMAAQQPPAQQQQPGQQVPSAISQAFPDLARHVDPNLLGQSGPPGLKVSWFFSGSILRPTLGLRLDPARPGQGVKAADYLGWNDEGSWIIGADHHVYVWSLRSNSLTKRYDTAEEIPVAVLDSLRSPAEIYLYETPDKRMDPNLPTGKTPDEDGLRIGWGYRGMVGLPTTVFTAIGGRRNREGGDYLGWNDKGSWIANPSDGYIYIWNLRQNRLTKAYAAKDMPRNVLASLHKLDDVPTPLAAFMPPQAH